MHSSLVLLPPPLVIAHGMNSPRLQDIVPLANLIDVLLLRLIPIMIQQRHIRRRILIGLPLPPLIVNPPATRIDPVTPFPLDAVTPPQIAVGRVIRTHDDFDRPLHPRRMHIPLGDRDGLVMRLVARPHHLPIEGDLPAVLVAVSIHEVFDVVVFEEHDEFVGVDESGVGFVSGVSLEAAGVGRHLGRRLGEVNELDVMSNVGASVLEPVVHFESWGVVVDVDGGEAEGYVEIHPFVDVEEFFLDDEADGDGGGAVGWGVHPDGVGVGVCVGVGRCRGVWDDVGWG